MTAEGGSGAPRVGRRVLGIGTAVAVMVAGLAVAVRVSTGGGQQPRYPAAQRAAPPAEPIASEAHVFGQRGVDQSPVSPSVVRSAPARAHRLTTRAMYRAPRAYPGAPPRIPHGLTSDEFRRSACLACHERGGFVPRFGAYAPTTPHPEYSACLQCHVPDQRLVGIEIPAAGSDETCGQCHVDLDAPAPSFVDIDWRPAAWPPFGQQSAAGSPPSIPHGFQMRGNCLACHAGPAAWEEIRTSHPERGNCLQCHLPAAPENGLFERPLDRATAPAGGTR